MKKHRKKQKKRVHMECHIFYYHVISVTNMIIAIYFGNLEKARSNTMGLQPHYIAKNGVPMEWVLTADECKVMRRFLADLKKAYALNSNLNVGKFMKMYRYLLNGYYHGRKIVAT